MDAWLGSFSRGVGAGAGALLQVWGFLVFFFPLKLCVGLVRFSLQLKVFFWLRSEFGRVSVFNLGVFCCRL